MQPVLSPALSLVIPVYKNEGSIAPLLEAIRGIRNQTGGSFEAVFVIDGSPDQSYARLREMLPQAGFQSQLLCLSRNFGAFAAIRTGLQHAKGDVIAVMAADLQEPPDLIVRFHESLKDGQHDLAFGVREGRDDPFMSKLASGMFWSLYRHFVMSDI